MESKLWGFYALAADRPVIRQESFAVADDQRLEKGPAFGKLRRPQSESRNPEDWPQLRHNPLRSGVAGTQLPATLSQKWKRPVGGKLTQPVVAEGKLVLASVDEHTVYALDAATGEPAWECVVGGRVDCPPAVHNGMVLFGCADGWVYCHRLEDGERVWRFFAAPADLRTVALDQLESLWPVHGSVLVLNDVVYCCAGRSSWIDGGMYLYGLDPTTGRVVCRKHLASRHPEFRDGVDQARDDHNATVSQNVTDYRTFLQPDQSDSFSMAGGVVADVLGSDGRNVFLHHLCMNTDLEEQPLSRHLFSTSSLLDDMENHRSHWVLGTGDFSRVPVAYSWIANGAGPTALAAPFGLMMVFDNDSVWLVRRRGQTATYSLVERPNRPFSPDEQHVPDLRRIAKDKMKPPRWTAAVGARPRAMIKSGDRLYLGCMPTEIASGDPHAAYEGRSGGTIQVFSAAGGELIATCDLPAPAVWDGMAAARQRLYVATTSGEVICLGER
jgi:outer membrane protein assembly factor BamB